MKFFYPKGSTGLLAFLMSLSLRGGEATHPYRVSIFNSQDLSLFLDCLAQVESGRNDKAIAYKNGKPYARGRYQITEAVWKQHTYLPWTLAHSFYVSETIARKHVEWLDARLERISISAYHFRPFVIAFAWRGGLSSWENQYALDYETKQKYNDYATRVANLYWSLKNDR